MTCWTCTSIYGRHCSSKSIFSVPSGCRETNGHTWRWVSVDGIQSI